MNLEEATLEKYFAYHDRLAKDGFATPLSRLEVTTLNLFVKWCKALSFADWWNIEPGFIQQSRDDLAKAAWDAALTSSVCSWKEDDDGNWKTACGEMFVFIDGGPKDNGFRHCPYCGGKL